MTSARPRILVTLADPSRSAEALVARRKNDRYLASVERAGGEPMPIDEHAPDAQRQAAFAAMDALLLSGGADVDPRLYGQGMAGARDLGPARDDLELAAYRAAEARSLPVMGICRGMQAINVFAGGFLVQHIDGHEGPGYGDGSALQHPIEVSAGTRLADLVGGEGASVRLLVNSYHHQGVAPEGLAPGLVASASAPHPGGILVEALESADRTRFLFGIQCHPERTESTPVEFERLFAAFVAAAGQPRGPRG